MKPDTLVNTYKAVQESIYIITLSHLDPMEDWLEKSFVICGLISIGH